MALVGSILAYGSVILFIDYKPRIFEEISESDIQKYFTDYKPLTKFRAQRVYFGLGFGEIGKRNANLIV